MVNVEVNTVKLYQEKVKLRVIQQTKYMIPHPLTANEYDGFLCIAEMKDPKLVYECYKFGIFPWESTFNVGAFFFPALRYLIEPSKIKVSKSIRPYFNQNKFQVTFNKRFKEVIHMCGKSRKDKGLGTWVNESFEEVYTKLHKQGLAHSCEVWDGDELVGGLYGVSVGKVFTGESMFSLVPNATRFGLISLARRLDELGYEWIDCQLRNHYLETFGGEAMSKLSFFNLMKKNYFEENLGL